MNDSPPTAPVESVVIERYEPNVRERQIDFLLEEEISCNPHFLTWLLGTARPSDNPSENVEVRRSVCDEFGEVDIQVTYTNQDGKRIALLIEDKIGAVFQPGQPERYTQRGKAGDAAKRWDIHRTCLIAPESYINRGHPFDVSISLESLSNWFIDQRDSRSTFKAKVVREAIVKASITGAKIVDAVVTEFRRRYFFFFQDFFRERRMEVRISPPANVYAGETWWMIKSGLLPRGVYIHHKAPLGFLDLTFPNTKVRFFEIFKSALEPDMYFAQTGKSSAVRLQVPKIEMFNNFDLEEANISESLKAVCRLLSFFVRNRGRIEQALNIEKTDDALQLKAQDSSSEVCTWVERAIAPHENHFELRFGRCSDDCDAWVLVAKVGQQGNELFLVEYLLAHDDSRFQAIRDAVTRELNFYLIDKAERDPWGYLKYHCGTAANLHSSIHWSFQSGTASS